MKIASQPKILTDNLACSCLGWMTSSHHFIASNNRHLVSVLSIVNRKKIVVCSNSAAQHCYSAAIVVISQYFVVESVSQNNKGLFKPRYAQYSGTIEPYLTTLADWSKSLANYIQLHITTLNSICPNSNF